MKAALLVIDVQMAFVHRDATGATRSCPEASQNIGMLLSAFRASGETVIHIHHHSLEEGSPFQPDQPGNAVQPFAQPVDGETTYIKHVNSGFIGTALEADLRAAGINRLVLCGGVANHCVETTARMAGNLGFDTIYVSDAVWAYGSVGPDGMEHSPEQVHSMSLANLDGEFATVLPIAKVLDIMC
jgi:nicotinamidase-related amidase